MKTNHKFIAVCATLCLCSVSMAADLISAVKEGNLKAANEWIAARRGVNIAGADGSTALHWAAKSNNAEMVKLLVKNAANVNAANRYGVPPLWLACVNGNPEIIELLLSAGADPNAKLPAGDTMLMTAARAGNTESIRRLLKWKADPNAKEPSHSQTALMWAAAEDNDDAVGALLAAGADVHAKSRGGIPEDPTEGGFTAFLFAVRQNSEKSVRKLLAGGANINDTTGDGFGALAIATASGHFDLAMWLLDHGAKPDLDGQPWNALHELAWIRRPQDGLNNPPKIPPPGRTDSLKLAAALLAHGADVNAKLTREPNARYFGRNVGKYKDATPFFVAAKNDDLPYMHFLIEHGANPHLQNVEGTTPLAAAAGVGIWAPGDNAGTEEEADEAVKYCLSLGVDPNVIDANGDTALHGAAWRSGPAGVQALVDAGAKLDIKGNTVEHRSNKLWGDGGWSAWRIAEGVNINNSIQPKPKNAALLRRLLEERGLPVE